MTNDTPEQNLIYSFQQAEDYFFRKISYQYLSLGEEGTAYMSGDMAPGGLNCVYIQGNLCAVDQTLTTIRDFYGQEKLPFTIVIPEAYCSQTLKHDLQALGCPQTEESIAMATELANYKTIDFGDEALIQSVDGDLRAWMQPLITAFDSTLEVSAHYAAIHEKALKAHAQFYHFSLYKEGQPVTSLTLSLHDHLARIDDVGTMLEHQGKGCATRLMHHALADAK